MGILPLLMVPFFAQSVVMGIDELHFHRARGLPFWERVGHPLDTLTIVACFAWTLLAPWSRPGLVVYVGLSLASCAFVTKDEPVHARCCAAGEHWLHAALFVLHPIVLGAAAALWAAQEGRAPGWFGAAAWARRALALELAATIGFGLYQAIYWNAMRRHDGPTPQE